MLHIIQNNIRRLAGRIGLRLVRGRRGSVLILVVVLLVLMALLGTAFLVTTRSDLAGSKLYEHNVQIDLLLQGLVNMSEAAISNTSYQSLSVPTSPAAIQYYDDWLTEPAPWSATTAYAVNAIVTFGGNSYICLVGNTGSVPPSANWGPAPTTVDHTWMASRFPVSINNPGVSSAIGVLAAATTVPLYPIPKGAVIQIGSALSATSTVYLSLIDNNTTPVSTAANWASFNAASLGTVLGTSAANTPVWPAISGPLAAGGSYPVFFEDPRSPAVTSRPEGVRTFVSPTYVTINGINFPALTYYSTVNKTVETALAASATGNGIADSFLWRLPIGSIDGITYYAAVRIVDNNSAVNVNTANSSTNEWAWNGTADFTTTGYQGFGPGMLPTGVGLGEMTYTYTNNSNIAFSSASLYSDTGVPFAELAQVNLYRCGGLARPTGIQGSGTNPVDDNNAPHTDFTYRNVGDALWNGLGRRISYPGNVQMGTPYVPFTWSDSAALAYRGDLINPNATPAMVEQVMALSVYNHNLGTNFGANIIPTIGPSFRGTPWDPINTPYWAAGYQINPAGANRPYSFNQRPYFVARNPISNLMPSHPLNLATPPNQLNAVTGLNAADMNVVQNDMAGTNLGPQRSGYFASNAIPKVSLNTADVTLFDAPNMTPPPSVNPPVPTKGPTLWLGFYNAMLDALQQNVPSPPAPVAGQLYLTTPQGFAQFRSPLRDINPVPAGSPLYTSATTYLSGPQTLLLRSLLAACNAKDLRDSDDDVTVEPPIPVLQPQQVIPLQAIVSGASQTVNVTAYGYEKQPFITEVYANNETKSPTQVGQNQGPNPNNASIGATNPKGYVLVELYNPYDVPINMTNWTLAVLTRNVTTYPSMSLVGLSSPQATFPGFASGTIIPARSYMILENYPLGAGVTSANGSYDANYRPWQAYRPAISIPASAVFYYVPNLHQCMQDTTDPTHPGGELVLLRPPQSNGGSIVPGNLLGLTPNNLVPVDSFDFSGMTIVGSDGAHTQFTAMHYLRPSPGALSAATNGYNSNIPSTAAEQLGTYWKFVYPGRWSATGAYSVAAPNAYGNSLLAGSFAARQEGIAVSTWDTSGSLASLKGDSWADTHVLGTTPNLTPIAYSAPISFGKDTSTVVSYTSGTPKVPQFYSSYPNFYPAIQLNGTDMGGPNKQYASPGAPFMFPFGGFARLGDVLQVPYIGSYTITNSTNGSIIEMNPITRDCAMADDMDNTNLATGAALASGPDDPVEQLGRFCPLFSAQQASESFIAPGTSATPGYDPYVWASHVFDYFSAVQNPNDDYFPNTDPNTYVQGAWNTTSHVYTGTPAQTAMPVSNSVGVPPDGGNEDMMPVDGLININTASEQMLWAVPFLPISPTTPGPTILPAQAVLNNQAVAAAIITYRNTYGPFKSLFDLNRVAMTGLLSNTDYPNNSSFQNIYGNPASADYGTSAGDISPLTASTGNTGGPGTDGVTNDFESRFAAITRLSNILTTRSDTYTVYVLVQGWSGVGTLNPQVVVQRRAAFIVDRSKLTLSPGSTMGITQVQAY